MTAIMRMYHFLTQWKWMKLIKEINQLPVSEHPCVSIIIPTYGKISYTLTCLASIAAHCPRVSFEIIVIDDGARDGSTNILKKLKTIRLLISSHNQGFIRSVNMGAQAARGEYLYILNNDTRVTAHWLDELVHTFDSLPGTGLVGSKLIYPDGRLQEAGGIIWRDGSGWNFGRNQQADLPHFNYAREVHYCSGASIMVPKALFKALGGLDEHYLPAYVEDVDLAFKIRQKGYRVIYQPLSVVIHEEGGTSGTDLSKGVKAYQAVNQKKLYERWQEMLLKHPLPGEEIDRAKDHRARRRILVIDACTPTPDQDAGSVIAYNLMLLLREMDFQVTFIPENNFLYMPDYTSDLQRLGIEMLYAPHITTVAAHLQAQGYRYDFVWLYRPNVANSHLRDVKQYCPQAKIMYSAVDLHWLRMSREAQLISDVALEKTAQDMKQLELSIFNDVDMSFVHSPVEIGLIREALPSVNVYELPLILEPQGTQVPFAHRQGIIFIGGYRHLPNVDAAIYLVNEIMPLLRASIPGICCYLVGSNPPAEVMKLAKDDVKVLGYVQDLGPLLDMARVFVAPLRYGAGIKGKIGTALGAGLPVVATSLAVEGMYLTQEETVMIADDSTAFANAVKRVYQEEAFWHKLSTQGMVFAKQQWGKERIRDLLVKILSDHACEIDPPRYELSLYTYD